MVRNMKEVLEEFSTLLGERLSKTYTTEDSVRYTFFAAILKRTNIAPYEIILEYPHPKIPRARVDTYISSSSGRKGLVVEFKYDRQIPSGRNVPRPQKAGKLFNDFYRLTQFHADPNPTLWSVYLTDSEMASYLRNERNGLMDFFELPIGEVLRIDKDYISTKSDTFQKEIGEAFNTQIKCMWNEKMPKQHELRVYEILPLSIT
jgi:hypothetical protein